MVSRDDEVKITESPKELAPKEKSKLIIEWSPSVTVKEKFSAFIKVDGNEIV